MTRRICQNIITTVEIFVAKKTYSVYTIWCLETFQVNNFKIRNNYGIPNNIY